MICFCKSYVATAGAATGAWGGWRGPFFVTFLRLLAPFPLLCMRALYCLFCRVLWVLLPDTSSWSFVIVPTAFVRPSRKIILVPGQMNSGHFIKRNRHDALSPVRRCSLSIRTMVAVCRAVCRKLPQCTKKKNNKIGFR